MNDLLALAIDAHGGLQRWGSVSRFRAAVSITGDLWASKGKPGLLADVVLEGETRDQRLRITPFPSPGRYATWEPYRQTIETSDGVLVSERRDPASSFADVAQCSRWDDLQVAYFAGEASWNYLVAPFLLARPDFAVEEADPWREGGEVWRRLVVTYSDTIVTHCRQQAYYFDDEGALRRLDYVVDVLGGAAAVHYPSEYREFDGIMVPTRRRAFVRKPDGSPALESTSVAIDVTRVAFD